MLAPPSSEATTVRLQGPCCVNPHPALSSVILLDRPRQRRRRLQPLLPRRQRQLRQRVQGRGRRQGRMRVATSSGSITIKMV